MTLRALFPPSAAYLNTGIILMNQGRTDEAKRTFLTCADIPDENLKDPHAHKSSVTSCLYNLGKLLHEQGHQEVKVTRKFSSILCERVDFSENPSTIQRSKKLNPPSFFLFFSKLRE